MIKYTAIIILMTLLSACGNVPVITVNPINDVTNTNSTEVSTNGKKSTHTDSTSNQEDADHESQTGTAPVLADSGLSGNPGSNSLPEGSNAEERDDPI